MFIRGQIFRLACIHTTMLLGLCVGLSGAQAQPIEVRDHTALRVCADPANLPFSAMDGSGFENHIAELLAKDLGVPVHYTWFPNVMGFYRRTLNDRKCDVVIGATTDMDMAAATIPYYRSSFMLVSRASDPPLKGLDDSWLAGKNVGAQAQTPVVDLLVRHKLIGNIHSYDLMVDSRVALVGHDMLADLAAGKIDAAVVWGPVAAYQAGLQPGRFRLVSLGEAVDGVPMAFDMAMAVRNGEPQWLGRLNRFIEEHGPELQAILEKAHVPLMDANGVSKP